jgi:hypothetical protein
LIEDVQVVTICQFDATLRFLWIDELFGIVAVEDSLVGERIKLGRRFTFYSIG